jgi:hypothetical protein
MAGGVGQGSYLRSAPGSENLLVYESGFVRPFVSLFETIARRPALAL